MPGMEPDAPQTSRRTMRQTTVRFPDDLWESLEREAERTGVSVAQYVRDSALARVSYEAGRRDALEDASLDAAPTPREARTAAAQRRARDEVSDSTALGAQSELARARFARIRADGRAQSQSPEPPDDKT